MTFHQDVGFQAPPPQDPVGNMNNMVNLLSGIRGYQSQTDVGNAYKAAIDPVTGQIDQAKLANALAASKSPWMVGPTGIQAGQSMEAQGRGTQAQLGVQQQQTTMLNGFLNTFDMSQPVSADQVDAKIQMAVRGGFATPAYYAQWQQMKQHMDPSELADVRPLIQAYKFVGQSASEQAERTMGPTVGQQAQILSVLNSPVQGGWLDEKTGLTHQGTLAQYLREHNSDPSIMFPGVQIDSQGRAVGGGGNQGGGTSIASVTTGRQPTGGGGTSGGPGPEPAPTASPYGRSTQPPPADTLAASRGAFTRDQAVQSGLGDRIYPLETALSTLRANPTMQTVGQDEVNRLKQVANAFGLDVGDMNNANAYQVLSKSLAQYMQNLPGANRSDLATLTAEAGSPHIGQAREAMQELLGKAVGYERMRGIGYDYFVAQHGGDANAATRDSGSYLGSITTWRSKLDPVAFAVDEMDPATVRKYFDGLSGSVSKDGTSGTGAKWRFWQSRQEALKLYPWLKMPTAAGQ